MNIFKELRKTKNITQVELAKALNLDQTTISKWESGKAIPDYVSLKNLSKFYDVSIDYLLGNENNIQEIKQEITTEEAKEIWFSTLSPVQQDLVNCVIRLNQMQQMKAQAYFMGMLG